MATIKLSNEAASAKAEAIKALLAGGILRIYGGSAPANVNDAESATLLAEFALPNPAFGTVANGVMTANSITATTGLVTGSATHWRAYSGGSPSTPTLQGAAATSGASMILNSTAINSGGAVSIVSWIYTQPKA
jgi:hypothetical protein